MTPQQAAEAAAVMQAYADGAEIEVRCFDRDWAPIADPSFEWACNDYRVAAPKPDEIDWSHVGPEFRWLARDADGTVKLFTHKPLQSTHQDFWYRLGADECRMVVVTGLFASYKPGSCNWTESLLERPDNG